jgi:hypothetical protein
MWPFKKKPKPIESSMLVDEKIVPDLMHRWNTWQEMLEALYEVEFNGPNDANPVCPSCYGWQKHEKGCKLDQAIKNAEKRKGEN